MALGLFAALANGAALPMFSLIFGNMTDAFKPDTTPDEVISTAGTNSMQNKKKIQKLKYFQLVCASWSRNNVDVIHYVFYMDDNR